MNGVGSVSARLNQIRAQVAAIGADAVVPAGVSGVYTAAPAAAAGAGGVGAAQPAFASVLAAAGAATTSDAGGVAGGPVSAAWTIPWLNDAAPSQARLPIATDTALARTSGTAGASASGLLGSSGRAAAVDDPLAAVRPLKGRISQHFGPTTSKASPAHTVDGVTYPHFHDGIDIAAPVGRPVRSIAAGKVIFAGTYPDGARVVRVQHADGSISLYAHLGKGLDVHKGDTVAAGQQLGIVGTTGHVTGPHLHLELLVNGRDADPEPVLERGRLPGATDGTIDTAVLGVPGPDAATTAALEAFDKVAAKIPFAAEIRDAAVRAGIDPLLFASLVKAESSFHPNSVSKCGAMGLTQLMPATAKAMGVEDPFDATQNLRAGAKYLARNLHIYGRTDLALAAYQAGKGAVARAGGIPDSPTTRHYIDRILHTWAGYQEAAS
jgi:murein DD-endopeptidase MepM/ murein hydrolase activator NlpD